VKRSVEENLRNAKIVTYVSLSIKEDVCAQLSTRSEVLKRQRSTLAPAAPAK